MQNIDLSKSIDVHAPNFQKDIIIPQIYDIRNIKVIQSCGFQDSPINKVAELKKKRIQSVIQGIVEKPKVTVKDSVPMFKSLCNKRADENKGRPRSHSKIVETIESQHLFMQIDEQMGEVIALAEENFAPFAERVKNVLEKARYRSQNLVLNERKKEADYFIKVITQTSRKKPNPELIKPIEGHLDELQALQNQRKQKLVRKRAQSAVLLRNNSAVQKSQVYKSNVWKTSQSSMNLKQRKSSEDYISKSRLIIQTINDCLQGESKMNRTSERTMATMKGEWGKHGALEKTFIRSDNNYMTPQTLNILKDKRLKTKALARIDNQYLKL